MKFGSYAAMDYAFWSTLLLAGALLPVTMSYDIACQWKKNLWKQLSTYPTAFLALAGLAIRFFIPNLHVHAHQPKCQTWMYFLLHEQVGMTHGETIEQEWAHIGAVATSTAEMGPAARRHTLDDHWGFWNFKKIVGFRECYFPRSVAFVLSGV
jgi:hypothetical protein